MFTISPRYCLDIKDTDNDTIHRKLLSTPQLKEFSCDDSTNETDPTILRAAFNGEDVSPPNAIVDASMINGIAVPVSTSAGWSNHAPRDRVYPTAIDYQVRIIPCTNNDEKDSLQMRIILEYENIFACYNETMMVRSAIMKSCLHGNQELALVSTKFQELLCNKLSENKEIEEWVDITADVEYTVTANQVVDAVLTDPNCDQTAGKATIEDKTIEVTLGPFSKRGRLVLNYKAETMYTYQAMSVSHDGADIGSHRLCPLIVSLPYAPIDHEAGLTTITITLLTPSGTNILPLDKFDTAYEHFRKQQIMKDTTILAVSNLVAQHHDDSNDSTMVGYTFRWDTLPPCSSCLLTWMTLPNPELFDDFVDIGQELKDLNLNKNKVKAVVKIPSLKDASSLQVPLPGHGPIGNLLRVKVTMPDAQPRKKPLIILNLTLSDKSGSTSLQTKSGATMRQRFNELAEIRFLKRLEAIPALVENGILWLDDIYMEVFLPFDHSAPSNNIILVKFRIGDVVNSLSSIVNAIRTNINDDLCYDAWRTIKRYVLKLRNVRPDGLTDFSVGPNTIVKDYDKWIIASVSKHDSNQYARCTFLEFDTDGGHNAVDVNYLDSLKNLCKVCNVRDGIVTGFGSWLNQDCASKVATTIGSKLAPQLALHIPDAGAEGYDLLFRRSFSAWVKALRQPEPEKLSISAGSISYPTSQAYKRHANGVEVVAVRRLSKERSCRSSFGPPDISNVLFTATVLKDVAPGEQLLIYLISRYSPQETGAKLLIKTGSDIVPCASVMAETESASGDFLAYDWLKLLTTSDTTIGEVQLSPLLSENLRTRMEDELSFRFNMASPSGSTSFLGRCRTIENRASIDLSHQPPPPSSPLQNVSSIHTGKALNTPPFCIGLFGSSTPSPAAFGSPASTAGLSGVAPAPTSIGAATATRTALFGQPSLAPMTVHGFGSNTHASTGAIFGSTHHPAPAFGAYGPSTSLFDQSSPAPAPAPGGLFSSQSAPVSSFEFGAVPAFDAASATGTSLFGQPSPASTSVFGGSATGTSLFGQPSLASASVFGGFVQPAPVPTNLFGGQSPAPAQQSASTKLLGTTQTWSSALGLVDTSLTSSDLQNPIWTLAMKMPTGSDDAETHAANDSTQFNGSHVRIDLACQRLLCASSIFYYCDICKEQIKPEQPRYHCFDCVDFDACADCRNNDHIPLHRVERILSSESFTSKDFDEDPLTSSLLLSTFKNKEIPPDDRATESSKRRVCRFLFIIVIWWPMFRLKYPCKEKLPLTIDNTFADKILKILNDKNGSIHDLVNVARSVLLTLVTKF